jgi:hypothetical protein
MPGGHPYQGYPESAENCVHHQQDYEGTPRGLQGKGTGAGKSS